MVNDRLPSDLFRRHTVSLSFLYLFFVFFARLLFHGNHGRPRRTAEAGRRPLSSVEPGFRRASLGPDAPMCSCLRRATRVRDVSHSHQPSLFLPLSRGPIPFPSVSFPVFSCLYYFVLALSSLSSQQQLPAVSLLIAQLGGMLVFVGVCGGVCGCVWGLGVDGGKGGTPGRAGKGRAR